MPHLPGGAGAMKPETVGTYRGLCERLNVPEEAVLTNDGMTVVLTPLLVAMVERLEAIETRLDALLTALRARGSA